PDRVSLFAYDNRTFIVQSFRDQQAAVTVSLAGSGAKLRNLVSGEIIPTSTPAPPATRRGTVPEPRSEATVQLQPHSYQVFAIE
ncbi:MAG TPA: hypothetical protein VKB34_13720, partial [Povalibacter sp.]|nr:hypothetical protein [Povalibacter sp.]